jgi:hypothetical protein
VGSTAANGDDSPLADHPSWIDYSERLGMEEAVESAFVFPESDDAALAFFFLYL